MASAHPHRRRQPLEQFRACQPAVEAETRPNGALEPRTDEQVGVERKRAWLPIRTDDAVLADAETAAVALRVVWHIVRGEAESREQTERAVAAGDVAARDLEEPARTELE